MYIPGSSVFAVSESILVVDGQVLGRFNSFSSARALLFGSYYIFNIQYPKEAAGTLEFLQRYNQLLCSIEYYKSLDQNVLSLPRTEVPLENFSAQRFPTI